jgi:hypothetical protein
VVGVQIAFLGIADSVGRRRRGDATSATNARGFGEKTVPDAFGAESKVSGQTHTSRPIVTRFRVGQIESMVRSRDVL